MTAFRDKLIKTILKSYEFQQYADLVKNSNYDVIIKKKIGIKRGFEAKIFDDNGNPSLTFFVKEAQTKS